MALLTGSSCCEQLVAEYPSLSVAFPNSTAYASTESAYWSLQEFSLTPSCIVKPTSSLDVSKIISTIVSNDNTCSFAIKAQGHAPAAGFANIDAPGVAIDLTSLNSVSSNRDHSVASVGAGASWLDVYSYLEPLGKSIAGGRNGAVGVGGLTLGGGISYFSAQVGFTCDTVVNFEIVLAPGELANANATSHAELYRALKGGGNNFGVATRFDFVTVNIGQILAGSVVNDISQRQPVFQAFANIASASEYDIHASLVTGLIFNSTSKAWTLSSTPVYTLPETQPEVYQELLSVPNISSSLHLTDLSILANESATLPLNWLFRTGTYGVSAALLEQIFDICNRTLYDFAPSKGFILWDIALEPLPSVILSHGAGKNVLGTSPADGNGLVMLLSGLWTDSASNELVYAQADKVMAEIHATAKEMDLLKGFIYANYAGAKQKPIAGYGPENVELLKRTPKKYDATGIFQKMVPGGFKF